MDMSTDSLAAALEREHHEIDDGIAKFAAAPGDQQPLVHAFRALRRHIYLEEEVLFPLLRQAEPALGAALFVMLREHGQIWKLLDTLEHDLDANADAASPALIRQVESHLLHHNLKEEKVVYPRADEVLPTATAERLQNFLDSGEMPDGWVCFKARPEQ